MKKLVFATGILCAKWSGYSKRFCSVVDFGCTIFARVHWLSGGSVFFFLHSSVIVNFFKLIFWFF